MLRIEGGGLAIMTHDYCGVQCECVLPGALATREFGIN